MGVPCVSVDDLVQGAADLLRDSAAHGRSPGQEIDFQSGATCARMMHTVFVSDRALFDSVQSAPALALRPPSVSYVAGYDATARALGMPPLSPPCADAHLRWRLSARRTARCATTSP